MGRSGGRSWTERNARPGIEGLPHRVVLEVLENGVADDWGPCGYGSLSSVTVALVNAGLVELDYLPEPPLYRARRTRRGSEWVARHGTKASK